MHLYTGRIYMCVSCMRRRIHAAALEAVDTYASIYRAYIWRIYTYIYTGSGAAGVATAACAWA